MSLTRAKIHFITPLGRAGAPDHVDVRFNPTEYTLQRNVNYADVPIPGLATPVVQFVRGETQTLSLELYLDASDRLERSPGNSLTEAIGGAQSQSSTTGPTTSAPSFRGIEADLELLRLTVAIDPSLHAPPVVMFSWGNLNFRGVVAQYSERFVMLDSAGHALRARITVMLKAYEPPTLQARALSRESPDRTKTRVVREGERLDLIALDEYGDATQWRVIASANGIARPRALAAGTVLVIPPL
jgi:hypothetical protein